MKKQLSAHEALARKLSRYLTGGIFISYNPDHSQISAYGRARGVGVTVYGNDGYVTIRAAVVASAGTTKAQWRTIRHVQKLASAAGYVSVVEDVR
jgi:hypothetical protein